MIGGGRNNFNLIAPIYDQLAKLIFGRHIKNSQLCFLDHIPIGAKVLFIGGGTGEILPDILDRNRVQKITYIEKSEKMLCISKKRVPKKYAGKVEFMLGDENYLANVDDAYDVIITYYFLDVFKETRLADVILILSKVLKKGGIWLFADFEIKRGHKNYWWQLYLIKLMFIFFKVFTGLENNKLQDINKEFKKRGFRRAATKWLFYDMIVAGIYKESLKEGKKKEASR